MKNKILFGICLLFGLMFINSGLNKLFNYLPVPSDLPEALLKDMGAFMEISWLMPLVAVAEIVGGILFIIPKFRALGAIIILPVLVGIICVHSTVAPSGIALSLVLLAINLWVIYEHRQKYLPMVSS